MSNKEFWQNIVDMLYNKLDSINDMIGILNDEVLMKIYTDEKDKIESMLERSANELIVATNEENK